MSDSFDLEDIEKILQMLSENDVTEFRLERDGETIFLRRGEEKTNQPIQQIMAPPVNAVPYQEHQISGPPPPLPAANTSTEQPAPVAPVSDLIEITSPMVGTFYRRPAVDAEAYVEVGSTIKKGDVLCIVEAMKLMNEIESEVSGKIVEICLEDAQMVEYGEVLFRVDPKG